MRPQCVAPGAIGDREARQDPDTHDDGLAEATGGGTPCEGSAQDEGDADRHREAARGELAAGRNADEDSRGGERADRHGRAIAAHQRADHEPQPREHECGEDPLVHRRAQGGAAHRTRDADGDRRGDGDAALASLEIREEQACEKDEEEGRDAGRNGERKRDDTRRPVERDHRVEGDVEEGIVERLELRRGDVGTEDATAEPRPGIVEVVILQVPVRVLPSEDRRDSRGDDAQREEQRVGGERGATRCRGGQGERAQGGAGHRAARNGAGDYAIDPAG